MRHLIWMVSLIFITACSPQTEYKDEEIAAIIEGKEITVKDIRSLYGLEEKTFPI